MAPTNITPEQIKACEIAIAKEIRDDLYYTLEGISGCKNTARAVLKNFNEKLDELGDTEELYDYFVNRVK